MGLGRVVRRKDSCCGGEVYAWVEEIAGLYVHGMGDFYVDLHEADTHGVAMIQKPTCPPNCLDFVFRLLAEIEVCICVAQAFG